MSCQVISKIEGKNFISFPSGASPLTGDVPKGVKDPLWYGLADRLKRTRQKAGLSLVGLSRLASCANGVPNAIEARVTAPGIDLVERLADALGVPPCWLAYGHEGGAPFLQRRPRPPLPEEDPIPQSGGGHRGSAADCFARVRAAREKSGFSLRTIAENAKVSHQAVLLVEMGQTVPKVDTLEAIAVALDVAPCWLAYGCGGGEMIDLSRS